MSLRIEVISDVICPWCFLGKRRLEQAIAELGPDVSVRVRWRPFELNPEMPVEGISRREYRTRKFGSWERSQELDRRVAQAGEQAGIRFAFDRMERTPNTFAAHRLLWLAEQVGAQDAAAESLFTGYFLKGEDVGDPGVLLRIGTEAGMGRDHLEAVISGARGASGVRREEAKARQLGVDGVPFFLINGRFGISGAQRPEVFRGAFRQALAEDAGSRSSQE